ncbi:MAG: hypothetical protein ACLVJH_02565 [Faecalibacterium prausnitzii]
MEKAGRNHGHFTRVSFCAAPGTARWAVSGKLRFLGAVVAILLVSYAITAILERAQRARTDTPCYQRQRHCREHSGTAAHAGRSG